MIQVDLSGNAGRPAERIDATGPFQEIHKIIEFLFRQVELGHLPPSLGTGGLRAHPGLEPGSCAFRTLLATIADPDIAEFGRKVGPFAQQRMAVDAGMAFPDMFSTCYRFCQCGFIRGNGDHVIVTVNRQDREYQQKKNRSAIKDIPCSRFGEMFRHIRIFPLEWLMTLLTRK